MNVLSLRSVWLALGILLLQAGSSAVPNPLTSFGSKVVVSPGAGKVGKPMAVSISLTNKSMAIPGGNVDLEIYNAQNKRVVQQTWPGQALGVHKSSVYHWAWKPAAAGVYTVKLGVFSSNWKTMHYWVDRAQTVKVS